MIEMFLKYLLTMRLIRKNPVHVTIIILLWVVFICGCAEPRAYRWPKEGGPMTSGKFRTVVLTDLDNDENIDVAAGGAVPNSLSVSYGDGRGGLTEPMPLQTKGEVQSIAVADINNDGLKDIVFSVKRGSSGIRVWLNQPGRTWSAGTSPIEINNYQGIEIADVNGDGNMDITAANATSQITGGIQGWFGDGKGNWVEEIGPTITGKYMDVALADFNGDGVLDLAGAGWGISGALKIWLGDGKGGWSSTPDLAKGSYNGLTAVDVDADGHLDILAATYRQGVQVFFGNGKGSFIRGPGSKDNGSYWDVQLVGQEGNRRREVVASSIDSTGVKVWKIKGRGSWVADPGRFPDSGIFYGMSVADLNNDGYHDICAASYGEGLRFWHGKEDEIVGFPILEKKSEITESGTGKIEENNVYTTIAGYPEYKIDPGDTLEITLWKGTEPNREDVFVKPDGTISFGFVNSFSVQGLTVTQLDEQLTEYLKDYVRNPRLDLIVKKYNSKFVSLTGAVGFGVKTGGISAGAGYYELSGKVSLLEMISRVGGPSRDANLKEVRIRRKNGSTMSIDLYRAIFQGDVSQDIILDAGDIVFVPAMVQDANRVYVFGEVIKPGAYTFTGSGMRVFDAISRAGGSTVFAIGKSTKVIRGNIEKPEVISVDLQRLVEQGDQTQNLLLANGDLIFVPRSFLGDINIFMKRIKPLLELILIPARTIKDYDDVERIFSE